MRSLKIADVERYSDLEKNTLEIEYGLTYEVDTCSFAVKGDMPAEGEEVIIEDGSRLFAGIVVKVELARTFPSKTIKVWKVDCDDYTALLDRRLVVETYDNMSASDIFLDIVAKYCPGFTTNGVRPGAPTVEYLVFDYLRPSECFRQLCDYVGWHWQPDYYKDLQFFSAENLASPAPMTLTPGGKFQFKKHTIDTQGLRNRVYVRGGTMLSDPQTVEWKADGVARTWVLPWKPHEVSFEVGEVPKSVGVENLHEEADYDYMMNFQEKYIRCSSGTTTPAAGTTMSVTAKQDIDVITMVEDLASQAAIAAVQGGDGIYEHSIVDDSLTTIQAAEAAGNADLREHANPKVSGSFETEVPGWKPGQIVDIQLPDRGVEGTCLVQKVTLSPVIPDRWTYKIQYGGRLLGIADFLKALVSSQQKKQLAETAILHKIKQLTDGAAVSDELTATLGTVPYTVETGKSLTIEPVEDFTYEETSQSDFNSGTLTDVAATGDGDLELAVTTEYGSDFTGGKTYSADSVYVGYPADNAFDNNESTRWNTSATSLPHWVKVDLGSGVTKTARKLRMKPYGSACKDFKLQGSNDNTNWTDIYTGVTENNDNWHEYTFNNSTAYRYYRIYVTSNYRVDGAVAIWEIEIMEATTTYKTPGTREKIVDLSGSNPTGGTKIEWSKTTPANTAVKVETALSTDGGSTYGTYQEATSGSSIPGIAAGTNLSNARLKIRETLSTTDTSATPQLHNLNLAITGMPEAWQTVGSLISISQPGSLPWANPQLSISEDNITWTDWQDIEPNQGAIEVPYPGYARIKADSKIQAHNWKKPFDESQVVCGFVEVG